MSDQSLKNMADWMMKCHRLEAELAALRADAEANKARYTWLADKVLACDYGDNDKGCVGWNIKHCKGPTWIAGDSIDTAIDAARKEAP